MRLTTVLLAAGVVSGAAGLPAAGAATAALALAWAPAAGSMPLLLVHETYDPMIERAFRAVLNRAPSDYELRRYRILMQSNDWTETDVRRDLRERSDYRGLQLRRGVSAESVVRRAYQDILGRDPDPAGLRDYTRKMTSEGWSEWQVRDALRRSNEYAATGGAATHFRTASADRIIRRAYQDVLGRDPDPAGLETYRRNILEEGWDEYDVRRALIRSPERRQKRLAVTAQAAEDMVRRAYRSVLNREPDAGGMANYTSKVLYDGWNEDDLVHALRDSDEFREKH
jgi:hypothetical protein